MTYKSNRELFIALIRDYIGFDDKTLETMENGEMYDQIVQEIEEWVDEWISKRHVNEVFGIRELCSKSGCKSLTTTCNKCGRVVSTAEFPEGEDGVKQ